MFKEVLDSNLFTINIVMIILLIIIKIIKII